MSKFRKKMISRMERELYSRSTVRSYVYYVADFASYYGQCPSLLGDAEIEGYLTYLVKTKGLSASSINIAYSSLRYFYEQILFRSWNIQAFRRPRRAKTLPEVLSREEMKGLLASIENPKHRSALSLMYSSGLRVGELVKLKVSDIDSDRMMVRVVQGKGKKDRYTILCPSVLVLLRQYWVRYRPLHWLFEGMVSGSHWSIRSAQNVVKKAAAQSGLRKGISSHTFRHSFATHLLEQGVDILTIKQLMGHKSLETTEQYLHIQSSRFSGDAHPLEGIL